MSGYQIIKAGSSERLTTEVMHSMMEGWTPLGGVTVSETDFHSEDHNGQSKDNYSATWAQAMTKP
jgi:hypothetical protein